jgi:hypothetical protein
VRLHRLEAAESLEVLCAIVVTWALGAHLPRATHVHHRAAGDHGDRGVLAALARSLVAVAVADNPDGTASDVAHRLEGTGVDSTFLTDVSRSVAPGRSLLLVLSGHAELEVVRTVVQRGLAAGRVVLHRAELPSAALDDLMARLEPPGDEAR